MGALDWNAVSEAFSKQAEHYDEHDRANPILQEWRRRVYRHVEGFLRPGASILELNAGTGIDAAYYAGRGYRVHATDVSGGMVSAIRKKVAMHKLQDLVTAQQVSFDNLGLVSGGPYDYVISNFGGLNCIRDLTAVTSSFRKLLKPGAMVSFVVMPSVCPWEILSLLRGNRKALRRLHQGGIKAQVEGVAFDCYYHKVSYVLKSLGLAFRKVKVESLGLLSAPPSAARFAARHPRLHRFLTRCDAVLCRQFPFNCWGDHVIVTACYLA